MSLVPPTSQPDSHAVAPEAGVTASWRPRALVAFLCAMGVAVLIYPQAAQWINAWSQANTIHSYSDGVAAVPGAERERLLQEAHTYNSQLTGKPPPDPYSASTPATPETLAALTQYQGILNVDSAMARIRVPAINVDLPIYHGTSKESLDRGVGHLFGTALPVGGASTHSVLTAHRGIPESKFFNRLPELIVGDNIVIDVLGEQLVYRVTATEIVLPHETDSLARVPNNDLLTLITCTPYAVNTHRLLVHAERTTDLAVVASASEEADVTNSIPFPWWIIWGSVTLLAGAAFVFIPMRWGHKNQDEGESD